MFTGILTFFAALAIFPAVLGLGGYSAAAVQILRGLFLTMLAVSTIWYFLPGPKRAKQTRWRNTSDVYE